MRIAELSRRGGVPVATVKYYLREGLLPPGEATARNQADYGEEHLHRLRLVRALLEVGKLPLASVREVLAAVEQESLPLHAVLGSAHHALGPREEAGGVLPEDVRRAREEIDGFLDALGWRVSGRAPARRALADALVALRRLGRDVGPEVFEPYAKVADSLAAGELAGLDGHEGSRADLVEAVVVGTVVFEAALVALRRLAQEHHSATRSALVQLPLS
ncbi:MAG: MerR family transcriptional regulator [Actinomycetota bacterium]|nr:MerR family transcriptional regulator [Actinomycetota bacterium]